MRMANTKQKQKAVDSAEGNVVDTPDINEDLVSAIQEIELDRGNTYTITAKYGKCIIERIGESNAMVIADSLSIALLRIVTE